MAPDAAEQQNPHSPEVTAKVIPESAPEIPASKIAEVRFGNTETQGRFSRLKEAGKAFASDLYQNAKINLVDRPKIWFNDKLASFVGKGESFLADRANTAEAKLAERQTHAKSFEKEVEAMHAALGNVSPDVLAKEKSEREHLAYEIRESQEAATHSRDRADKVKAARESFEQKRDSVTKEVTDRIEARMSPVKEKISNLESKQVILENEINSFQKTIEDLSAKLSKFEDAKGDAKFAVVKEAYQKKIEEVQAALGESQSLLNKRIKQSDIVSDQLDSAQRRTERWAEKSASLNGQQEPKERAKRSTPNVEGRPDVVGNIEFAEDDETVGVNTLMNEWNNKFGSIMRIDLNLMKGVFPQIENQDAQEQITQEVFENAIITYYRVKVKKSGASRKEEKEFRYQARRLFKLTTT